MRHGMRRLRTAAALLVVAAVASYGAAGPASAESAAVPALTGGCWSYAPGDPLTDLAAPPAADLSTALEPWSTLADGGLSLGTAGATVVGGSRTASVDIASGPVVSPTQDAVGTASFLLSIDGTPLAAPVTADFAVAAGQPVTNLTATAADLAISTAGSHRITLDAVYFDLPAAGVRVACNGQTSGAPGGPNPATDPVTTGLAADFTAVATPSLTITEIDDQAVLTTARPGDVVTVAASGLASSTLATVQLCDATSSCTPLAGLQADADGVGTATVMVPGGATVGAGTLQVDDGTTNASTPLSVLGVQTVAAAEELESESTAVTLTGTGWDPGRAVTIQGYAGTDSSADATDDPEGTADVAADGTFSATYEVSDQDTESVIVDQARAASNIGAVYLISGVIGSTPVGGGDDGDDTNGDGDNGDDTNGEDGSTTETPGATTDTPITAPAPVAAPAQVPIEAPADIPLPGDVPVEAPAPETPEETTTGAADLSVSEARLDGRRSLSELFGGSPQRSLVFLVENVGDDTVLSPIVRVSVGRSEDVEPQVVAVDVKDLDPGEQTVVSVPLELPIAAFGTYYVVGQVGDTDLGALDLEWTTYPWGLFALNALALALLAVGIRHRLGTRRSPAPAATPAAADTAAGDSVVDLTAAGAWWAYRAGSGPRPGGPAARPTPRPARPSRTPRRPPATASAPIADEPPVGEAIVDLDAAEQWWGRRSGSGGAKAS